MFRSNRFVRFLVLALLLAVLAGSLSACGIEPPRGRKPSPDWSRATYLGQFVNGAVGLAVEPDGGRVHLVWPTKIGDKLGIHYTQLNARAEITRSYDLALPEGHPRSPRLIPAENGQMHLLWAIRTAGESNWQLWSALLSQEGDLLGEPTTVSPAGARLESYEAVPDGSGGVYVVWALDDNGGVMALAMDAAGQARGPAQVIAATGESPAAQVDGAGNSHLAWRDGTRILYAMLPAGSDAAAEPVEVAQSGMGTGVALIGPQLGLSDGWVYVLWYKQNQSGLEAGTARTEYVAFPSGSPAGSPPQTVGMYGIEEPPYQTYSGSFPLTTLVGPASSRHLSDFVYRPAPLSGERPELAVALSLFQEFRQDVHAQTVVALFRDGEYIGYEPASKTESLSEEAVLAVDAASNLYMAWREGAAGTRVYYATTEPGARAALDRLNSQDVMQATLRGGMEGLSGLAMLPFALVWIAPGLIILIVLELGWSQERQSREVTQAILSVAIVVYLAAKLLLFPTILTYVPFSAWLDLPAGLGSVLRVAVPLAILGVAVWIALRVRKRRSDSNLLFYVALVVTDAVLTLIVYGVNFWSTA